MLIQLIFVEFVLELEDTFGEEINDEDAEKLSTIGEVVDYICRTHCQLIELFNY